MLGRTEDPVLTVAMILGNKTPRAGADDKAFPNRGIIRGWKPETEPAVNAGPELTVREHVDATQSRRTELNPEGFGVAGVSILQEVSDSRAVARDQTGRPATIDEGRARLRQEALQVVSPAVKGIEVTVGVEGGNFHTAIFTKRTHDQPADFVGAAGESILPGSNSVGIIVTVKSRRPGTERSGVPTDDFRRSVAVQVCRLQQIKGPRAKQDRLRLLPFQSKGIGGIKAVDIDRGVGIGIGGQHDFHPAVALQVPQL